MTGASSGLGVAFAHCFAEAGEYTAEFALDEIRYTRFEGSPAMEASRAYEANVTAMEVTKAMINASLRLLA